MIQCVLLISAVIVVVMLIAQVSKIKVADGVRGCSLRHRAVNSIIHRSLRFANIPSKLEPFDLYRSNGRRPDGTSILPLKSDVSGLGCNLPRYLHTLSLL